MTRNFRLSYPNRPSHTNKRKNKNNFVTRNFWLSFQRSDQACLLFLVTFYNYPARSMVDKEKKKKRRKQNSYEKFSAVLSEKSKSRQKRKNKIVTRNFWLTFQKSDPDCLYFLVTFYNYPARSIVDKEKRKKTKKVKRNIQLSYPSRLSHTKKRKRRKNKIVTRNIQLSFQKSDQACFLFLVTFYSYPARSIVDKEQRKKKKNKIVTRNFQLSCIRTDPVTPKKKKQNSDKKYFDCHFRNHTKPIFNSLSLLTTISRVVL